MGLRKEMLLRLEPAVHDALTRWAADEMRSANAQIDFLLRRALADAQRLPGRARGMRSRAQHPAGSDAPAPSPARDGKRRRGR